MVQPAPATPPINGFGLGCLGLLSLGGAAMMIFGITFIRDAQASKNWPIAQGEVISTRPRLQSSTTNNTTSPSSRTYTFEVTYAYEVAGERYESDRFSLGNGSTASKRYKERSEAVVAANKAYPVNRSVDVYYDPKHPESAVLQPGASWATYMPLVLGAVFLASGVGTFWTMRNMATQSGS